MEALILAAGRGSRLGPFGAKLPKTLVEIGGRPIVWHQMSVLYEAGIRKVTVVVGYEADRAIPRISECAPRGMRVDFVRNPFYSVTNTLGSFWMALPHVSDELVYMNGDTIFDRQVLMRVLDSTAEVALAVDDHPCQDEEMKVLHRDGFLTHVSKEVDPVLAKGEFIGLARFQSGSLRAFAQAALTTLTQKGPMSYTEAGFEAMIEAGSRLAPVDITGLYWQEIDFPADLERARKEFPLSEIARGFLRE